MVIQAFLIYVLAGTFSPGPNNLLAMVSANESGYRKTLKFLLGMYVGALVVLILASFLNLALTSLLPQIIPYLKIVGFIYIIYLALSIHGIFKSKEGEKSLQVLSFKGGLLLQFVNPKVILYSLITFSTFIIPFYNDPLVLLLFSFFLGTIGFISINVWAITGSALNRLINNHKFVFNLVMSFLLIYTAIMILLEKV